MMEQFKILVTGADEELKLDLTQLHGCVYTMTHCWRLRTQCSKLCVESKMEMIRIVLIRLYS